MPKEELSLDVIKQYTVVRARVTLGTCGFGSTSSMCSPAYVHLARMCQLKHNLRQSAFAGKHVRMLCVLSAALPDAG